MRRILVPQPSSTEVLGTTSLDQISWKKEHHVEQR